MQDRAYWETHYVVESDADEVARCTTRTAFVSNGVEHELLAFEHGTGSPSVLISPGSGGHAYVFAELAFRIHRHGFNVFVMPRHGGAPLASLVRRHYDAVEHIGRCASVNGRVGIFGEGLGGYAVFYLALAGDAGGSVASIACQNSPALCTERSYRDALGTGGGGARRRRLALPVLEAISRVAPRLPVPISLYLDFGALVDAKAENRRIEAPLVEAYRRDPDFDRWYPLDAALSLVRTPPPRPLAALAVPTLFVVPVRGVIPEYERTLFARLPRIPKRLVEVDDGVFWMCAHPTEAARVLSSWFSETV